MALHADQPDAIVLGLTWGMSLRAWKESGMLTREWALYSQMLHHVPRLIIVSYGDASDSEVLASVAGSQASSVQLVCNDQGLSPTDYLTSLASRVAPALAGSKNIVFKTNQLAGGDVLIRLAEQLRSLLPHATIATIARGGYLWSRFLAHEHGPDSKQAKEAETRERTLCQAADLVVGTTQDMVKDLTWRYTLDPSRTMVIPNYVVQTPRAEGERTANMVLYAGQLAPRKRVDMLIRACEIAAQSMPSISLRVIGEGPSFQELQALATELKVNAEFLPRMPHDDLMRQMDICGIYAQASELEGHPKTVIEAMSRAAPVVVTDAPGMSDVVQHGVTGLRCAPNAEALGQAIAGLMMDADWANVLGQSARDCTLATLGLEAILPRELSAYRIALARASGATMLRPRAAM